MVTKMARYITLVFLFLVFLHAPAQLFAQDAYQVPGPELVALVDGARTPSVSLSPDRSTLLLMDLPALPSIAELAQPELRLAGMRINPNTNGPSRPGTIAALTLRDLDTGADRLVAGLPEDARITTISWSPDSRHFAFLLNTDDALELWVVDTTTASARKLTDHRINNTYYSNAFTWARDSQSLMVKVVPTDRGDAPTRNLVPAGPTIQENIGAARPARTYQDLLSDSHDEALFDYYFTAQLMEISLNGDEREIGEPAVFRTINLSPDGNYLLVSLTQRPYSYSVPGFRFPELIQVWDTNGSAVRTIADLPLADRVPIAFSATTEGPRSLTWRNDAPATLFWVEALDGGDPAVDVPMRDRLYSLPAPFTGEPIANLELEYRFSGLQWSEDGYALVSEFWRDTRHSRTWKFTPDDPAADMDIVFDLSTEDRYNDPGSPDMRRSDFGTLVLNTQNNGEVLLMRGIGATPEGNRPFLSRFNMRTGETTELWRSQSPHYERISVLLNDEGTQLLTLREAVDTQPNYFRRDLQNGQVQQLTQFEHPTPQLRDVHKEFIQYQRADGVQLSATLYLPPGYVRENDGPLPVLVWAYPREFRSADAAGQVADSPYRFAAMSYWGPHFALTQGFAVVENATMPVVGEGDEEPNDTFVEQLVLSAQAVIDELANRGVGDPDRVAIGGHSYGAFMTANLLAHSDLFRAGIARSGAFNRTLTPFGFQAEPRNFWDASDIYYGMSPFMHADKIRDPILFIHGAEDNNSGTFPMQSERMYAAVSGLGGTARLVMLPEESHGYNARESVLHMLWEQSEWINRYVRGLEGFRPDRE